MGAAHVGQTPDDRGDGEAGRQRQLHDGRGRVLPARAGRAADEDEHEGAQRLGGHRPPEERTLHVVRPRCHATTSARHRLDVVRYTPILLANIDPLYGLDQADPAVESRQQL